MEEVVEMAVTEAMVGMMVVNNLGLSGPGLGGLRIVPRDMMIFFLECSSVRKCRRPYGDAGGLM